jgi:hypothetical protein
MESTSYAEIPADVKSTLGAELLADIGFGTDTSAGATGAYWQSDDAWVVTGGQAVLQGSNNGGSASGNEYIQQSSSNGSVDTSPLTSGKLYKVTGTLIVTSFNTSEKLQFMSASSNTVTVVANSAGVGTHSFSEYFVADGTTAQFRSVNSGADSNIALDNISIKEVTNDLVGYWALDATIDSSKGGEDFVLDRTDETTTQVLTNSEFTSDVSGWGGTSNCSLTFNNGSLRQTGASSGNMSFQPSSLDNIKTAVRIEAKCTLISGTHTPRFEIRDGANANWLYPTGTTVGAVTTFDIYISGVNNAGQFNVQSRGSDTAVVDWDYIKLTKYNGNTGELL